MAVSRTTLALALPLTLSAALLTGCGSSQNTATSTATTSAVVGSSTTNAASSCPTDNTQAFPKVRFVTNLGLAGGAFHRWVWKPYQAGTFKQGADGRTTACLLYTSRCV